MVIFNVFANVQQHMNELLEKLRQLVPSLASSASNPSKSVILQGAWWGGLLLGDAGVACEGP